VGPVPGVLCLLYCCDGLSSVIENFNIVEFEDYELLLRDVLCEGACHVDFEGI
ncbi:10584_t:CDS:2, partial [Acaulospora colombiana]